jgi:predicted XRE-type DNA-binding protein
VPVISVQTVPFFSDGLAQNVSICATSSVSFCLSSFTTACHFGRSSIKPLYRLKNDMANTLDLMDIKQIITLQTDGLSNRKIAETLGISRNTVNSYMKLFRACEYSFEELLSLDDASLTNLFPSHTTIDNDRFDELMGYFEQINQS